MCFLSKEFPSSKVYTMKGPLQHMKQAEKHFLGETQGISPMDTKQPVKKHMLRRSLFIVLPLLTLVIVLGGTLLNSSLHKSPKAHADSANFQIRNEGSGLCLNARPDQAVGGNPYFYPCNTNDPNQLWHFSNNSYNHTYNVDTYNGQPIYATTQFQSVESVSSDNAGHPLCLDHANQKQNTGYHPYLYDCYGGEGQAWRDSGYYYGFDYIANQEVVHYYVDNNGVELDPAQFDQIGYVEGSTYALDGGQNAQAPTGTTPYLYPHASGDSYQSWDIQYV